METTIQGSGERERERYIYTHIKGLEVREWNGAWQLVVYRDYCKDSSIPCYPEVSSGVNAAVSPS